MTAPLPQPRGAALAHSWRAGSPGSSQPSRQPLEWRQLRGKVASKPPSTSHSAASAGPFPPLLPSLPPSRGGKEGSSARRAFRGQGKPVRPSRAHGASRGLAAGATRPVSSSPRRLLPPPPPASPPAPPPAPASASSRSPLLGELQTRKQLPPHPRLDSRTARLQVHRNPASARAPSGARGRVAQPAAGPGGQGPRAHRVEDPLPATCTVLRALPAARVLTVRYPPRASPGASQKVERLVAEPEQTPEGSCNDGDPVCLLRRRGVSRFTKSRKGRFFWRRHGRHLISLFL
ncbi:basic salivary proline-rich protein 2-like [Choloepus didactylus]|uniref:basic salivary proline-rich protein 2-like n=1 Tax=Choloepus didactylus TaxID=27675 RepID=UPI00189D4835|nr:basic salivary proline-rich protein 2-like [Choloepus didactylus]